MTRRPLLLVGALALLAAACSDDGRTLAPIRPGQTTTTTTVPPSIASEQPVEFSLVSAAFENGAAIPTRFTCEGEDISPPLGWVATPAGAELAIVVRDRQADGFVHWLVTGIDIGVTGFGQAGVPEGAAEQVNSTGAIGWLGPCPPAASGPHIYEIALHVLAAPVEIDPALPAAEAATIVETASTAQAVLTGIYEAGTGATDDGASTEPDEDQPAVGSQPD